MSENQGIHIDLTANTAVFTAKMRSAQQTLTGLKNEVSTLKTKEASLESSISKLADKLEKKQKALDASKTKLKGYEDAGKGASASAEKLRQQIEKQEASIKEVNDKIDKNSRDLKENASSQDICANKIRLATVQIDALTNEYSQNTQELRENEAANKDFTNTLKTGLMTLKGIALGYAGKTLYSALIGTNAEYEQYLTSFDVLLQSSEKAEKMINNLDKFGADTPFELPDLTSATEQLLAFGTAEEDVMTRLQQLGDLSKGKADILERITLAYGKMQAKGKVTLEELNMLTEAGVPILRELANQIGVTTDVLFKKISDGEINIEHINTAIAAMTSEGGQFFGMMAQQAQTMDGMMSTLGDNINIALRQLGEGAFDAVKDEISGLLAEIQRMNEDGTLKAFAANAGSTITSAVKILLEFISVLYDMRGVLLTIGTAAVTFKVLKSGADMVSKASATIKAYTAVLKLMHQAHENGITKSTLFNAALGKEEAVIKTLETAGYKDVTVKKGMVTATNAATSATETFKVASMGLNAALGLVSAAISIGIMAYSSYTQKQEEARQAAYSAADAAQEEKKSVEELVDEYKELRTAGDWDDAARERAREIQEELTKLVGGEVEGLDLVNGRLEEQVRLLDEATLKKAKDNASSLYDAEQAAGKDLWNEIKGDTFELSTSINDDIGQEIIEDLTGAKYGMGTGYITNFHQFLDLYPRIIQAKNKLYEAGQQEGALYNQLTKIVGEYSEKYNAYMEELSAYQENEATIHLGEYMQKNDINSKEAFDTYIKSIDDSKEHSEQYKEVLKQIANEAFPQFSGAAQDASSATDGLADSADGLTGSAKSASDTINTLNEVGENLSALGSAQEELNEKGKLTTSTIADIKDNFSGLGDELDGYISKLIKANGDTEATEQVMGEMTSALIESKFSTEELANADVNLIATMLEEAGAANSVEYATYLVNSAKVETAISTFDFANATGEEIGKLYNEITAMGLTADEARMLIAEKLALAFQNAATSGTIDEFIADLDDEADALGITKDKLIDLIYTSIDFNNMELDVSQKIQALNALATAALGASRALSFERDVKNTAGQIYIQTLNETGGDKGAAQQAYNDYVSWAGSELQDSYFKNTSSTPSIRYTGGSSSGRSSGSSGGSSGGSASNEQLKAYKEDIAERERADERYYKQQREYGKISDEEFYQSLDARAARYRGYAEEVLSLSYLTEEEKTALHKDYIETAEDIELEAFKGRKSATEKSNAEQKTQYQKNISEFESADERYYKQQREYGKISDEEFYQSLDARATRYRGYAEEVLSLSYLTEEEKTALHKDYIETAEDLELQAFKEREAVAEQARQEAEAAEEKALREAQDKWNKETNKRYEDYDKRYANSLEWIGERVEFNDYDEAYAGLDRVAAYTDEFYTTEYQKLKDAYEQGLITAEEYAEKKENLDEEYLESQKAIAEKRKGILYDEVEFEKDTYNERLNNSKKWINEQLDDGSFEAVYGGLERIKLYTDKFYADELKKLDDALANGIISQEEYLREVNKLVKDYGDAVGYISDTKQSTVDAEFLDYVDRANKYISDRNFYGDWAEWGDTEEQALARMFDNLDDWRAKGVSNDVWIEAFDEVSKNIFEVEKENLLSAIEKEEELLREKYQKQLDMKKEAAEKELEIEKEKAESEIEAINAAADKEIERINELIQKRKEAREDEDYNLRLKRLQLKLEYEHDENNKIALQKEINKLKEEISDMEFDREMERQKKLIEENRDKAIESVNESYKRKEAVINRKMTIAENRYKEQTSDEAIAEQLAQSFNYSGFQAIAESMGIDFSNGISRGLQGILSAFNEAFNLSGASSNYDYSSNSNTYNMYASFVGAQSQTDIIGGLRKFLDQLELEGRS